VAITGGGLSGEAVVVGCPLLAGGELVGAGPSLCSAEVVASVVRLTDVCEGIWLTSLGPGRAVVVGVVVEGLFVVSGESSVVERGRVNTGKTISFTAVSATGGGPVWK
jgi:hypothetical protein